MTTPRNAYERNEYASQNLSKDSLPARPDLFLSVRPPALPSYGYSKEGVRAFLENLGYDIPCIAVDH